MEGLGKAYGQLGCMSYTDGEEGVSGTLKKPLRKRLFLKALVEGEAAVEEEAQRGGGCGGGGGC